MRLRREPPAKLKTALIVNIDLGIGDPVTPGPYKAETACTLGEGSLSWQVYPIETMLAEKIHALVILGDANSRSKDVYDIDLFWPQANIDDLRSALKATFTFRGDGMPSSFAEKIRSIDTSLLKRGWVTATLSHKERPRFETVMESLLEKIEQV